MNQRMKSGMLIIGTAVALFGAVAIADNPENDSSTAPNNGKQRTIETTTTPRGDTARPDEFYLVQCDPSGINIFDTPMVIRKNIDTDPNSVEVEFPNGHIATLTSEEFPALKASVGTCIILRFHIGDKTEFDTQRAKFIKSQKQALSAIDSTQTNKSTTTSDPSRGQ